MPGRVIHASSPEACAEAVRVLCAGGVIVYPTETVYGLGGNPARPGVFGRIAGLKRRDPSRAFPLLLPTGHPLDRYVRPAPGLDELAARFWPGALTLVMPAAAGIPDFWTCGTGLLGVRRSADPVAGALVDALDAPLVSTSANLSGGTDPVAIDDVAPELKAAADLVLDDGPRPSGRPSTVLLFDGRRWQVRRVGALDPALLPPLPGLVRW